MQDPSIIAVHGSHNATVAAYHGGEIYVVEIERFVGYKNSGLAQYKVWRQENIEPIFDGILNHIHKHFNFSGPFDICLWQSSDVVINGEVVSVAKRINANVFEESLHHESHANGSFYQSDYTDALIFSYDGGGNDGLFNVYKGNRGRGVELIGNIDVNLGFPYMIFGEFFSDIAKESVLSDANLVYAGKIMGLEGYGEANEEWLPHFEEFYDCDMHNNITKPECKLHWQNKIEELSKRTSIDFDLEKRFSDKEEYDIAATSQKAFENVFLKYAEPYINDHPKLPIILTGGCALNILLNTRVKEEFKRPVFVAPNSSDCGLALGMLLGYLKPKESIDITYAGIPLLDYDCLFEELTWANMSKAELPGLAAKLKEGKIVGVARGQSEHGPRALGNRSVLCDPSFKGMKDILNKKVKHREWFRPFAPVVRLEDVNKYFIFDGESKYMAFAAKVRKRWQKKLEAITHVDGTARIQTVTRKQNPWLYDLLTEFSYTADHGVLLNTSFNDNGKPILATVKDAIKTFRESEMDILVVEDYVIEK